MPSCKAIPHIGEGYVGEVVDFDSLSGVEVSLFRTRDFFGSELEALTHAEKWAEQVGLDTHLPSL